MSSRAFSIDLRGAIPNDPSPSKTAEIAPEYILSSRPNIELSALNGSALDSPGPIIHSTATADFNDDAHTRVHGTFRTERTSQRAAVRRAVGPWGWFCSAPDCPRGVHSGGEGVGLGASPALPFHTGCAPPERGP